MRAGRTMKATATTGTLPLRLALFVMGAGALLFEPLQGQHPRSLRSVPGEGPSPVVASHTQAVDVLKAWLEGMGGQAALQSLEAGFVDMDIRRWILGQEPNPGEPRAEPVQGKYGEAIRRGGVR